VEILFVERKWGQTLWRNGAYKNQVEFVLPFHNDHPLVTPGESCEPDCFTVRIQEAVRIHMIPTWIRAYRLPPNGN
jgi:hypothetical protein